jgi:hypothetical protein
MPTTHLTAFPACSLSADVGRSAGKPSVGIIVAHGGVKVAVHATATEAREHAKALLEAADLVEPPAAAAAAKGPVAGQTPAPDRLAK